MLRLPQAAESEATAQLCSEQCLEPREKEEGKKETKRAGDIQVRTKPLKLPVQQKCVHVSSVIRPILHLWGCVF